MDDDFFYILIVDKVKNSMDKEIFQILGPYYHQITR